MPAGRVSHDDRLLDTLASLPETTFAGTIWRVVNAMRSPLDGSRGAGRWNLRTTEVLYSALEADGALSEIHFHVSRGQSVFPSRLKHELHALDANLSKVLDLSDPRQLETLGVDMSRYAEILYDRTQIVGEAVAFLGFEAIIVPNARHRSRNLVVFLQNTDLDALEVGEHRDVNWQAWRAARR